MFAQFMRRNRYKIAIFALMTLASGAGWLPFPS
jgi:hypothetical protein